MTFLVLLLGVLVVYGILAALALADRVPDTHREVTRHGDYRF
ncbi:hypothetical protein [Rhodococcoides corynebacterioides]|nr:hypothetical protein [Rhodococcus corynebacterioides]